MSSRRRSLRQLLKAMRARRREKRLVQREVEEQQLRHAKVDVVTFPFRFTPPEPSPDSHIVQRNCVRRSSW